MFSNIIDGFIFLQINCDSKVPAVGTGYTSNTINLLGESELNYVCLDCRESSYIQTTVLCVFSNIIGGFIFLHFHCDS